MMTQPASPHQPRESWGHLIGTLLLVLFVVGVALAATITLSITMGWARQPEHFVIAVLLGSTVGEMAAFGFLLWRLHQGGRTLRDLGWGQPTRWWSFALGMGIAFFYSGYTTLSNPVIAHHLLAVSWFKLLGLVAAMVAGLVEETIFRGYVMTTLGRMGYGLATQVLLSGLFFAFFHLYGFANLLTILLVQGFTFLLGVALAITYQLGKRSLTPVIISHALIDIILEPWLFLSFFGGR